jgi:hypothetical protein
MCNRATVLYGYYAYWILDTGYWILDTGYWILDTGYWILDTGYWIHKQKGKPLPSKENS